MYDGSLPDVASPIVETTRSKRTVYLGLEVGEGYAPGKLAEPGAEHLAGLAVNQTEVVQRLIGFFGTELRLPFPPDIQSNNSIHSELGRPEIRVRALWNTQRGQQHIDCPDRATLLAVMNGSLRPQMNEPMAATPRLQIMLGSNTRSGLATNAIMGSEGQTTLKEILRGLANYSDLPQGEIQRKMIDMEIHAGKNPKFNPNRNSVR